jgi:aconitate hydratase
MMGEDLYCAKNILKTNSGDYIYYRLKNLEDNGLVNLDNLPFSIRILLENVLRNYDDERVTRDDIINLASWNPEREPGVSFPFMPARVIMQDFTGVPALVDLAAMRSAMARLGGDPGKINPQIPVDLVIDHSVQVDFFATPDSFNRNAELEFVRNRERYEFLHWGQQAFDNFRVVPPANGIVHQVNLEYLASVVMTKKEKGVGLAYPDTLVGTDSHTTMINGLGVVGWGVGGIEAEAALLGQPIDLLLPDVVGFKLVGSLAEGVTATDLTLTIVQMLRKKGVVEKFVEFYGPGLSHLSLPDRATIANMAPEYGATIGFFPVDDETLRYLHLTGRSNETIELIERYLREQKLFRIEHSPDPHYSDTLELELGEVEVSLAGPKRPQDRISLSEIKPAFRKALTSSKKDGGFGLSYEESDASASLTDNSNEIVLSHGSIVIAAITSCTNTSNPSVMIAAGLLARNAINRGLRVKPFVKTSLAPGSRVVSDYLEKTGLLDPLEKLGFNIVGYGCTTCIGNSGPLKNDVVRAINDSNLVTTAILSGNRNFEGRIHPYVRANYLASPPLVVAYALAGRIDHDMVNEPLGYDQTGVPVFLRDIFPIDQEISGYISNTLRPDLFKEMYRNVFSGNQTWNEIQGSSGALYNWNDDSTYIQEPPFFVNFESDPPERYAIENARILALLGDSITTDHISPAGSISMESPAGRYLLAKGIATRDFNSYGSRRGNDQVMTRGSFANIRLKNRIVPESEGGVTLHFPDGEEMSIFDAAQKYKQENIPLIIIAGREYGAGSSRDWAAKGTLLLGVKAVMAESFERIHRSNLVGMGVLPLQFLPGENVDTFGIVGNETFWIPGLEKNFKPSDTLIVRFKRVNGSEHAFNVVVRLDTAIEVNYYHNSGILHTILREELSRDS